MLVIRNKQTKEIVKNTGTNSAFPDGNIPNISCGEDEEIIRLHDKSELAQKILLAKYKYKFNDDCTDIIDIETVEEKQAVQLEKIQKETQIAKLQQIKNIQEKTIELLIHIIEENNLSLSALYQAKINKYKELKS